jgi:hypothetical protein
MKKIIALAFLSALAAASCTDRSGAPVVNDPPGNPVNNPADTTPSSVSSNEADRATDLNDGSKTPTDMRMSGGTGTGTATDTRTSPPSAAERGGTGF